MMFFHMFSGLGMPCPRQPPFLTDCVTAEGLLIHVDEAVNPPIRPPKVGAIAGQAGLTNESGGCPVDTR